MSSSEHDFSETSSLSPQSLLESPYSSPSQQVPHLVNVFSGISCMDDITMNRSGKKPFLRIVEQPQNYFRFRYKSEMVGTHGSILGKTTTASKNRTHPTVELHNYSGKALIRVKLVQIDKDTEHPHKLLEDEQEDRDVAILVPDQGSYRVGFAGMGIIHTAKKDVISFMFKKMLEEKNGKVSHKELLSQSESIAKGINLNIVKLRFSAHDVVTDKEICPPVFSDPIHNMKSAATNDLKICRISRYCGKPKGGDDVFIFVEKVNKKNIQIRFYEMNENDEEVWSANANFLQSDVHHQYGIVFRTPPYKYQNIDKDVKVHIELMRPSDGRTSEPKEFVYKANIMANYKRPRLDSTLSSLESCSGGPIKNYNEVPTTVEQMDRNDKDGINVPMYSINIPQVPMTSDITSNALADALAMKIGVGYEPSVPVSSSMLSPSTSILANSSRMMAPGISPLHLPSQSIAQSTHTQTNMFPQNQLPDPPVISLNSAELERLINHDQQLPSEEKRKFIEMDWGEYMQSFGSLTDKGHNSMEFLRTSMNLVGDSRKIKPKAEATKVEIKEEPISPAKGSPSEDKKSNLVDKNKVSEGYNAYYTARDGDEVKKLVVEICDMFKNKSGHKKQILRDKLERLFELRLSNGDTFLHMALNSNQPTLEWMIKMIHSMKMTHLLNLTNDQQQSILHFAIINDLPKLVSFLVSKGCDPMVADIEGNNAVHYAVMCQTCLKPLLDAMAGGNYDLNACNNEGQTPLHLCAVYDSGRMCRALCAGGAHTDARDAAARTPAHLAAYDAHLDALLHLLDITPRSEIDEVDGAGYTVLQILCSKRDGVSQKKLEIIKLLLDKGADVHKQEVGTISAWKMCQNQQLLREMFSKARTTASSAVGDHVKSEPEDDYESTDEDRCLRGVSQYMGGVAALLDAGGAGGGWRAAAARLQLDALSHWFANTPSPTTTMLTHIKESGDPVSSKSLALILEDIGEKEAAAIIRRYID